MSDKHKFPLISLVISAIFIFACPISSVSFYPRFGVSSEYEILNVFPHDPGAYTEGFFYHENYFFESTGLYGQSSLRKIDPQSGEIIKIIKLPRKYFAEGIAMIDGKIYQLTWRSGIAFVYDAESFEKLGRFEYPGEGWGLTTDGEELIMSDGTCTIRFLKPETFDQIRSITVNYRNETVRNINELEYAKGWIFANIWQDDRIIQINPETGKVNRFIDLGDLVNYLTPQDDDKEPEVLNGIAYNPQKNTFYVTGKFWGSVFEIRLK
jgi:glutamine cyclotransferase